MTSEQTFAKPAEKRVLLVDDDAGFLDLLEISVKKEGFQTERSAEGKEALSKAHSTQPDLIVLDMALPGMGGYEIIRELQALGSGDIPIIIVSGRTMDRAAAELLKRETNVREILTKPFRMAALSMSIHRVLKTAPAA